MLVLLSGSRSSKLALSMAIDPERGIWAVVMESDSLGEWETENKIDNLGFSLLRRPIINCMIKGDTQGEMLINLCNMYILYVKNVDKFLLC